MKLETHGTITDGKFTMSAVQIEARKQWLANKKEGAEIVDTLSVAKRSKTNRQLGAYWGLGMSVAEAEFDRRGFDTSYILRIDKPTGNKITKERLYEFLLDACPIYDENGNRITLSKTNTIQMAQFYDACRNYLASQYNVQIPEIDPNWRKK